jgi:hypothetical protein
MNPYADFPHAAAPLPHLGTIVDGESAESESGLLLEQTRPVVLAVGALNNLIDWGYGEPSSFASIGRFLTSAREDDEADADADADAADGADAADAADAAEAVRAALFEGAPGAVAKRIRTHYQRYAPAQADELTASERERLIAVKGARTVARILAPTDDAAIGHVILTFENLDKRHNVTGRILVSRETVPGEVPPRVRIAVYGGGRGRTRPKTLVATLEGAHDAHAVDALFEVPSLRTPMMTLADDAAVPRRKGSHVLFYEMPLWYCEHIGTLAQEAFRLHVLASVAQRFQSGAGRLLVIDRVHLHVRMDADARGSRSGLELRAVLHPSSAECLCCAHAVPSAVPKTAPSGPCMVLRMCGLSLSGPAGRCPCHCAMDPLAAPNVDDCCARDVSGFVACNHETPGPNSESQPEGAFLWLKLNPWKNDKNEKRVECQLRNQRIVRNLLACGKALAQATHLEPGPMRAAVQEARRIADASMLTFERETAEAYGKSALIAMDERAYEALYRDARKTPPALAPTHGHLFKARA